MSLSAREIADVAGELAPLQGGFLQKVWLPEPRFAFLELRKPGASHLLALCAEPGRTRLHLASERPPSPEQPHPFQGLLRAELIGAQLQALEALPGERAVRLRFRAEAGDRVLVAELTGRHGNLFLLDERGAVRGSAVPNLSEVRDNRPGHPYVAPLPKPGPADDSSRFGPGPGDFPLSRAIEQAYQGREREERVAARRRELAASLKAARQKLARTVEKVRGDVARASAAEDFRRSGELLKANLSKVRRGQAEVRLVEYTESGPREVAVKLDPARTPRENLDRAFHQYRRLLAGHARASARLASLEQELARLDERLAALETLSDQELLRQPAAGAATPAEPGRARKAGPRLPFREHLSPSGQRIRVGRGPQDNDALTFRHSKGNDAWLHARGVAGAHVVVPLGRDEALKDETLRDAALLAAHHSEARGEVVDVAVTRVKYVRKVKGAPGAVTYSQDKTVAVRPDPDRLAALQATTQA